MQRRAAAGPFGTTIAHGFLTLSLVVSMLDEVLPPADGMTINYGVDRVRFPAPVPSGSRIRGRFRVADVTDVPGGRQLRSRRHGRARRRREAGVRCRSPLAGRRLEPLYRSLQTCPGGKGLLPWPPGGGSPKEESYASVSFYPNSRVRGRYRGHSGTGRDGLRLRRQRQSAQRHCRARPTASSSRAARAAGDMSSCEIGRTASGIDTQLERRPDGHADDSRQVHFLGRDTRHAAATPDRVRLQGSPVVRPHRDRSRSRSRPS